MSLKLTQKYIFRTTLIKKIVATTFGLAPNFILAQSPIVELAHFYTSLNLQKNDVFSLRKYIVTILHQRGKI